MILYGCSEKKIEQNALGRVEYYVNNKGQTDGLLTQYHNNGSVYWVANFVDGLKQGTVEYHDSIGNLVLIANYLDGELDGTNTEYYSNGKIKWLTEYSQGKKVEKHLMYSEDSTLLIERSYFADSIIDEFKYDSLGRISDHYIIVMDSITRTDLKTTFTFSAINAHYDSFGISIVSIDSNNEMDTLFQRIVDEAQFSIDFNNGKLSNRRIEVQYLELDSSSVIKGLRRFAYNF